MFFLYNHFFHIDDYFPTLFDYLWCQTFWMRCSFTTFFLTVSTILFLLMNYLYDFRNVAPQNGTWKGSTQKAEDLWRMPTSLWQSQTSRCTWCDAHLVLEAWQEGNCFFHFIKIIPNKYNDVFMGNLRLNPSVDIFF